MSIDFSPCGVITVITDFGHKGPFVGTMKGVILSRFPAARTIDLTHEAYVHWPAEAGFWLERSYHYFPTGTVHLAVVDPGVGTDRNVLLVVGDGHAFLAPDNGLLAGVIERTGGIAIHVAEELMERIKLDDLSATFHGRDLFAPLAAALAAGQIAAEDFGVQTESYTPSLIDPPHAQGGGVHGIVITKDHFGNLITNIDAAELAGFRHPVVRAGGREIPLHRIYGDVNPGDLLALVNSFGVVEIAKAEQSAADELRLSRGAPVVVAEG